MKFIEFLKEKRENLKYTQNGFAKIVGITQSYYNNIERGEVKNPPSEEVLDNMAKGLKLTSGETYEFKYLAAAERTPAIVLEHIESLKNRIKILEAEIQKVSGKTLVPQGKISELGLIDADKAPALIPVFPRISAGLGALAEEEPEEYVSVPGVKDPATLFAVRVNGDSMEPTIKNKSLILCRQCTQLTNNEIGAFIINDDAFVKRLKVTDNYTALISDNPNYNPIYIAPDESFKVVGRVIKVINDIQ